MEAIPVSLGTGLLTVLLQSGVESRDDFGFHPLEVVESRRSQAFSNTRLTITASGFGCP